ncbi:11300_t:CDS:2 [Cetraspora pellucida]|uniref:11300_t:CDS:1 n=1 Tax=Cetraspora pellucida TaxID=1433469 RepID=A0ACA9KXR0_9GLOM|nr:11300_t:CDS:2 [Cetraspora pellucida]
MKKNAIDAEVVTQKKTLSEKIEKLFHHIANQLVNVLLDLLDPYEDFNNAEPCSQVLNIDIAVFLNSFIDYIETNNKDK